MHKEMLKLSTAALCLAMMTMPGSACSTDPAPCMENDLSTCGVAEKGLILGPADQMPVPWWKLYVLRPPEAPNLDEVGRPCVRPRNVGSVILSEPPGTHVCPDVQGAWAPPKVFPKADPQG